MPFDAKPVREVTRIAAYVCTDQGATVARSVVERNGGNSNLLHGGGLSGAGRMSESLPDVDIVLTEIGNIPVEMACECVSEICRTGADVIVLGEQTDIGTYRALLKSGALEYFAFPVTADDILSVEREAPRQPNPIEAAPPQPVTLSPVVAVAGCTGGVGASLLAQNLSFHAGGTKGNTNRTALLDADLHFGSQAIDLDRDETVGLFEALKAPDRVDTTFLNATMDHVSDHFSMYSHQARAGQNVLSYESGLSRILPALRTEFDAVVIDLPRTLMMQEIELTAQIDTLVLVIPAGFSGVTTATRVIERLSGEHPDLRIVPVLSEVRKDAGLSHKDVAATIGLPIAVTLPECGKALLRAHRAARPLIESQPKGAYASAVRKIWTTAMETTSTPEKPTRKSLIKRVFG